MAFLSKGSMSGSRHPTSSGLDDGISAGTTAHENTSLSTNSRGRGDQEIQNLGNIFDYRRIEGENENITCSLTYR